MLASAPVLELLRQIIFIENYQREIVEPHAIPEGLLARTRETLQELYLRLYSDEVVNTELDVRLLLPCKVARDIVARFLGNDAELSALIGTTPKSARSV